MDLLELYKEIRASGEAKVLSIDKNDPRTAHVWNPKTGTVEPLQLKRPIRSHRVTTVVSFFDAAELYAPNGNNASVWVNVHMTGGDAVLVIEDLGDGNRCDRVTLPIAVSPLFKTISTGAKEFDQKQLLKWLRHDAFPAACDPEGFELSIQSLVWHTEDTEEGQVGSVKSTMGRQIRSEAKGEKPIATQVAFSFDPFPSIEEYDSEVTVKCSVFVEPEERKISVLPLPGQIDAAISRALNGLSGFIHNGLSPKIAVLCGVP